MTTLSTYNDAAAAFATYDDASAEFVTYDDARASGSVSGHASLSAAGTTDRRASGAASTVGGLSAAATVDRLSAASVAAAGLPVGAGRAPLSPPIDLTVVPLSPTELQADWTPIPDATFYVVQQERWDGAAWVDRVTVNVAEPPQLFDGLEPVTTYRHRVRSAADA